MKLWVFAAGVLVGFMFTNTYWQKAAVERGAGVYCADDTFHWGVECPTTKED